MRLLGLVGCVLGAAAPATVSQDAPAPPVSVPAAEEAPLRVERGEGFDPVEIPRDEELDFVVQIDLGILGDPDVGKVSLSSGVEVYRPGLPPSDTIVGTEAPRFVGWIRSLATGYYLGYTLRHELDVRHLPQAWPSVLYRDTQSGSENRRRELKLGLLDGKDTALYRSDGHCKGCNNPEHFVESAWAWGKSHHCDGCKRAEHRVWDDPEFRSVPPGSVDLLTAVYLARAMVRENRPEITFPVVDKQKLWTLTVSRKDTQEIQVPAGRFHCALVSLETKLPPGERKDKKGFEGLFGIQGSVKIWMDAATGVPVLISGELPVPVIRTLVVNVKLDRYRGTPSKFAPVR